jgi:ankyrin repeat protein
MDGLALAKVMLAHGANPNARMKKAPTTIYPLLSLGGATPFLLATKVVDLGLMKLLLDSGADPTIGTTAGATPLMVAAGLGYSQGNSPGSDADALKAVQLCLELGGDVSAVDKSGNTALHGVALRGALPIVTLLVEKGARLDAANSEGWIPLRIAQGVHIWPNYRTQLPAADLLEKLMSERAIVTQPGQP